MSPYYHLGQELVVEDSLGEGEPVPLLLPEPDLVSDGGGDGGGDRGVGQHVHVQEPDDLIGCNAAPECLSARVSRDYAHTEIRKP